MRQWCVVPKWNNTRQQQVGADDDVHNHHTTTTTTIPNLQQVKELAWENGQIAEHGLLPLKPTWARTGGTLESIVHQATVTAAASPKRRRVEFHDDHAPPSGCSDATMLTWASFDSPNNLKGKNADDDSVSHGGLENQDEDEETKDESGRSNSTRRSRAAAVHNQSERRRRDRINQKMKALQKLVPNSSKTDKASMLDEVIDYLKQLQAQVHLMNTVRSMQQPTPPPPPMMMPLAMQPQHHLQMSLLAARMGMGFGMGMGMLDINSMARAASHSHPLGSAPGSAFVSPQFMAAPLSRAKPVGAGGSAPSPPVPLQDPYYALLAQSMNMELYSKMAAFYGQQVNQAAQSTGSPSRSTHGPAD